MSVRASNLSRSPRACSGGMYCGVPTTMPTMVIIAAPSSCRAERTSVREGSAPAASLRPEALRETPVHHQHLAVVAEHDVLGLQIAVDDALAVREGERVADLLE
jgi:hypothetical protein